MGANKKEGQRNPIPPQIFNGEDYRGDYEAFDISNEDDELEEFLGLPRKNPKVEHVKTGATAVEVGRIEPGKLVCQEPSEDKKDTVLVEQKDSKENIETNIHTLDETDSTSGYIVHDNDTVKVDKKTSEKGEGLFDQCNENLDKEFDGKMSLKGEESDTSIKEDENSVNVLDHNDSKTDRNEKDDPEHWKKTVEADAKQTAAQELYEKTDGLTGEKPENEIDFSPEKEYDSLDDSSDESSDEDNAIEYMPDGELIRKKSRGFRQLENCKRFWKASQMV